MILKWATPTLNWYTLLILVLLEVKEDRYM